MKNTVVRGLVAGLAGVAVMTAGEKREQLFTRRPNLYVPAHTLEKPLGLPHRPDREQLWLNWSMHWGQGVILGPVRTLMAERGLRGPVGSFLFLNLRSLDDQTLKNVTGIGAPHGPTRPTSRRSISCTRRSTLLPPERSQIRSPSAPTHTQVPRRVWTLGQKP